MELHAYGGYVPAMTRPSYIPPSVVEFVTYAIKELRRAGRYQEAEELHECFPMVRVDG